MILSASRRTDIPCFYSDWLLNRLREGCVMVRNPMNRRQVSRLALSPACVDAIVFWTKDPAQLLGRLDELDGMGYRYLFQFTLTPYDKSLEPGLRDKASLVRTFQELSGRIGPERMIWRYDPIVVTENYPPAYHEQQFAALCEQLCGCTEEVIVSFVDPYRKLGKRIEAVRREDMAALAAIIGETAAKYRMSAKACCEDLDLTPYGIGRAACIDRQRLERLCGGPLSLAPDKNQRPGCGCCESVDIGAYNSCLNGCVYCYANHSAASVQRHHALHDPSSSLLIGHVEPEDRVTDRAVNSDLIRQTSWFTDEKE